MAKAPKPVKGQAATQAAAFKITVNGIEAVLDPMDLGPKDDFLVRHATRKFFGVGVSLTGMLAELDDQSAGADTVLLLWWLGRRKGGEDDLALADAADDFPSFDNPDAIVFELIDPKSESAAPLA